MPRVPPQSKKQFNFHLNDKVTCDFDKPGSQMGGKTPKFSCKLTRVDGTDGQVQTLTPQMDEEPVKVKFGADNREVFAEPVATRLMWALGYYADAWFPVRVVCNNCPDNPESGSGAAATRNYDQATIVRKADGHKMYEVGKEDEGWSWKELDEFNGRPTYERDGLKLLGAFMQHSDNKPPQQRLVCDHVKVDSTTTPPTTTCGESRMLVQDVGATFGSGGLFTSNGGAKVNLGNWSGKHLWNKVGKPGTPPENCPVCQAALTKSLTAKDGLSNPTISEEGRRFLAGLMCQLSDPQIEALFKTAAPRRNARKQRQRRSRRRQRLGRRLQTKARRTGLRPLPLEPEARRPQRHRQSRGTLHGPQFLHRQALLTISQPHRRHILIRRRPCFDFSSYFFSSHSPPQTPPRKPQLPPQLPAKSPTT